MQKILYITAVSLLSLLLICSGCLAAWLYYEYVSPEEIAAVQKAERLEAELAAANSTIQAQSAHIEEDAMKIADHLAEISELEREIERHLENIDILNGKITVLLNDSLADDEYQALLLDQINTLNTQIAENKARISELDELIGQYENITTLNFGYQAKKISDLLIKLAEPNRPLRTIETETVDPESAQIIKTVTQKPTELSFYYQDLETGYTLSYNSDDIMYSASLIKAPYIYSLLKAVSDFEYQKLNFDADGNPLYDENGMPLFEGQHPNLDSEGKLIYAEGEEKYDLSRIWTFDKEKMTEEGSGVIKGYEDGYQLTYLQLIEYTLKYSDNTAFAQLRKMFGYTEYYAEARALGVRGSSYGFMQLSANDCGLFLEALYSFIQNNEKYGSLVREAMIGSNYPYLIPYNVSPTKCAHKYGWDIDSYHDMAIVYNEHPYILVIMTDYDDGGSAVNTYIGSVVRAINSIHKNFYASR